MNLHPLPLALLLATAHADVISVPHPESKITPGHTVVWSLTFQAAWDQSNLRLGGAPALVKPPNVLMGKLDSFEWDASSVMPDGSWKAWSGPCTRGFLNQVNQEATEITHESKGPFTITRESPESLAFFGLLDHKVEYPRRFFRSAETPMEFQASGAKHSVQFFGVKGDLSEEFGSIVRVLAWRPVDRSFAIQIACKDTQDTVVLYRPSKALDFATACRWLRTWRQSPATSGVEGGAWNEPYLHLYDQLRIPYISLDVTADFHGQLTGARYYEKQAVPWKVQRAQQHTRFQLDESGARIRVESSGGVDPFGAVPEITPRCFHFDRPFFVFLWRNEAHWPYFGAWIGDDSALRPFEGF